MRITLYHDALIPPPKYGGTERIVYWLARALAKLGHNVTLIARPGSKIEGVQVIELPTERTNEWESLVPPQTDLIHLWATPGKPPKLPFLVTIQGNGRPGESFHPNTVFISGKHAQNHGAQNFVYNGIDPAEYPCDPTRENYLVYLAKASWKVKNLAGAIQIARAAKLPLYVMGSRDWPLGLHRLLPTIRGVKYLGMVGDVEKRKYLRKARGLLFPVRWHEPFGIAITEALAAGCPVFGTPYGSLPEIVDEKSGVLSDDARTLVQAIREKTFSPENCRQRVSEGFDDLSMAKSYLKLYERLLQSNGTLQDPARPIATRSQESAETLLPFKFLN